MDGRFLYLDTYTSGRHSLVPRNSQSATLFYRFAIKIQDQHGEASHHLFRRFPSHRR
jgi:hypothetical protein